MYALVALGAGVFVLLVWLGRHRATRAGGGGAGAKIARAILAVMAAAAAVAVGLRGGWLLSLGLAGLSAYLAPPFTSARGSYRNRPPAPEEQPMSRNQAHAILGVGPNATDAEIDAAYRSLMRRAHPDLGGSTGLAAQVNAARDRLRR